VVFVVSHYSLFVLSGSHILKNSHTKIIINIGIFVIHMFAKSSFFSGQEAMPINGLFWPQVKGYGL
jgi:hypothetical protein